MKFCRYWGNTNDYLGSDTPEHVEPSTGFPDTLAWPGLGAEAAQWILDNRGLKAIGADAMSFDVGHTGNFYDSVHTVSDISLAKQMHK